MYLSECAERKLTLENVMAEAKGKVTVIAHVACNNTADSCELAAHAQSLGVDAIASIPPIYFHLPEHAIAKYWNDISAAAPETDFIIYNIPQLAGVALSVGLLREMKKNPRVIGVKKSSMPVQDIQMFADEDMIVFNGPDEQFVSGLQQAQRRHRRKHMRRCRNCSSRQESCFWQGIWSVRVRFRTKFAGSFTRCARHMEICTRQLRRLSVCRAVRMWAA